MKQVTVKSVTLINNTSPRKQPKFRCATTGFPAKWRLRNERRNSILITRHYPDLVSASDWLKQICHAARPIRSTTQNWLVTRHQYGISALVSQTSFRGETSGSAVKCRLLSQTKTTRVDIGRFPLSPKFRIFWLEIRSNWPLRFGSTGIFGTSFEGGPLWPFGQTEMSFSNWQNCCPQCRSFVSRLHEQ